MSTLVKELVESGVHFGHRSSRWNPKMRPYIYTRRNMIHIIDVRETIRGLLACQEVPLQRRCQRQPDHCLSAPNGRRRYALQRAAERCGMPYVNDRWLGGTLTNFRTIRSRLSRLEELERIMRESRRDQHLLEENAIVAAIASTARCSATSTVCASMNRLPECMVVVDPKKEKNAVKEARKLGIATVALIDTDCDPDQVDLPIPGNDDSMRSIDLIINIIADAIAEGKAQTAATTATAEVRGRR